MLVFPRASFTILMFSLAASCVAQAPAAGNAGAAASSDAAATSYRSDPKFQDAWKEAQRLKQQKQFTFAVDSYKKANKIAGGRCTECLQSMYQSQMMMGSYKDAIATTVALEGVVATPNSKAVAASERGQALLAQGGSKPKPAVLADAHAAFQQALALNPKSAAALYWDGKTLATMGKTDDARTSFEKCVSCIAANDPIRLRAQHFAENPELSTHPMAPAFEVTALDGSRFNLDAMGGRVVLIDFWATWCGPCNEELPHIKKIAKEFAGQPLVIISVSWDSDEARWKQFIQKNEMTWVQYRDADHKLSNLFEINAIPHYFTIDADGVLTAEMLGEGSNVEGKLKKLVAKARESQAAQAMNVPPASAIAEAR